MNTLTHNTITIRTAYPDDADTLWRLAALDDSRPLTGKVLVAEVDGEIVAAMSGDGRSIADPFEHTGGLVELLRMHADGVRESVAHSHFRIPSAPQPA